MNKKINWHKETVKLLSKTNIHKGVIAKKCKVSERWVTYLANGQGANFSVTKVQKVYDFLVKQQAQT